MARVPGASLAEVAVCPARALDARSGPSVPGARRRPALAPAPSRARGGSDSARRLTVVLGPRRPSRRAHRTGPGTPLGPAGSRVCSPRPPPPGAAAGRLRGARGRGRGPRRSQCSRGCGRLRLRLSQSVSPQQWRKEVSERSCSRRLLSLRPSACARGPARGLTTLAGRPGRPAAGWGASAAAACPLGPAPTCSPSPCWTAPPRQWRKSGRTSGWRSVSSGFRSPCSAASSTGPSRGMSGRSACTPASSTGAAPAPARPAAPRRLRQPRRGRRHPPGPPLRPAPPPGPPRRGRPRGWAQGQEQLARGCRSAGAFVCWTAARWRTCCKSVGARPTPLWSQAAPSAGALPQVPCLCATPGPRPRLSA